MKRVFLIGCGSIVLLVAIAVGLLIWQTPQWIDRGKKLIGEAVAEEARLALLERTWRPPTAAPDAQWFPSTVGEWRLERSEPVSSFRELGFDRAGQRAIYRSGAGPIEVNVIPVSESERAEISEKVKEAAKKREPVAAVQTEGVSINVTSGTSQFSLTRGNRSYLRVDGDRHTRTWWLQGTLFLFRARGSADSEAFPEALLRAISPPSTDAPLERH